MQLTSMIHINCIVHILVAHKLWYHSMNTVQWINSYLWWCILTVYMAAYNSIDACVYVGYATPMHNKMCEIQRVAYQCITSFFTVLMMALAPHEDNNW